MASRSEERANAAIKAIQKGQDVGINNSYIERPRPQGTPGKIIFVPVDLTDLGSVGDLVDNVKRQVMRTMAADTRREKHIDVLFANAGIMAT
jgi:NAD(P)-dependent dehydrogenase (short-subunit alcohol dehydrogenase family)